MQGEGWDSPVPCNRNVALPERIKFGRYSVEEVGKLFSNLSIRQSRPQGADIEGLWLLRSLECLDQAEEASACIFCGKLLLLNDHIVWQVKMGKCWSDGRQVNAGAPQGSVLGCYLYNIGVDNLEEQYEGQTPGRETQATQEHLPRRDDFPVHSTPTRVRPLSSLPSLTPIKETADHQECELLPRVANAPPWLLKPKDPRWRKKKISVLKFVDDGINADKINMREERLMLEEGHMFKETNAPETAGMLEHIRTRAEKKACW